MLLPSEGRTLRVPAGGTEARGVLVLGHGACVRAGFARGGAVHAQPGGVHAAWLLRPRVHGPRVCAQVLACALMGCTLNYTMFLCTTTNTALTTTIVGVLKGVVSVGLGA